MINVKFKDITYTFANPAPQNIQYSSIHQGCTKQRLSLPSMRYHPIRSNPGRSSLSLHQGESSHTPKRISSSLMNLNSYQRNYDQSQNEKRKCNKNTNVTHLYFHFLLIQILITHMKTLITHMKTPIIMIPIIIPLMITMLMIQIWNLYQMLLMIMNEIIESKQMNNNKLLQSMHVIMKYHMNQKQLGSGLTKF